jgi:hypothetical protein
MGVDDELAEAMRELEYDERWILYGFISSQEIVAEYVEYKVSLDSPVRPLDAAGNRRTCDIPAVGPRHGAVQG